MISALGKSNLLVSRFMLESGTKKRVFCAFNNFKLQDSYERFKGSMFVPIITKLLSEKHTYSTRHNIIAKWLIYDHFNLH